MKQPPRYSHCEEVPDDLRWDVTPATASRPIEVSFGGPATTAEPWGPGAPFKRVRNLEASRPPTFFRLDEGAAAELFATAERARAAADEKGRAARGGKRGGK